MVLTLYHQTINITLDTNSSITINHFDYTCQRKQNCQVINEENNGNILKCSKIVYPANNTTRSLHSRRRLYSSTVKYSILGSNNKLIYIIAARKL